MGIGLTAAGALCLAYYAVIVLYAGIGADFAWFWVFAGLLGLGAGRWVRKGGFHALPGFWRIGVSLLFAAGLALFLILLGCVFSGMSRRPEREAKADPRYILVLGAQVKGEVPSRALAFRLEEAARLAGRWPKADLILSGGQGAGEDISEAECMRRYLEKKGIARERLLLEAASVSTWENLKLSEEAYGCAGVSCALVSNNFHIFRAVKIAEKLGYRKVFGSPAGTDSLLLVHNVVREVFALLNEWRKGTI